MIVRFKALILCPVFTLYGHKGGRQISQSVDNDYRYGQDHLEDGLGRAQEDMPVPGVIIVAAADSGGWSPHTTER